MALPTTYTAKQVAQYMETVLGETAHKLGFKEEKGSFAEPVNEVLLVLGEEDFSFVNTQAEVKKVRLVARMEAWRAVMYYTAHEVSHSAGAPGTGQVSRDSVHRSASALFAKAESEFKEAYPALVEDDGREVSKWTLTYENDSYSNRGD